MNSSSAFHVSTPGMCFAARLASTRPGPSSTTVRTFIARIETIVRAQSTWRSICWRSSSCSAVAVRRASPDAFARIGIDGALRGSLSTAFRKAAAAVAEQQRRLPGDRARGRERGDLAEAVAGRHAHVLEAVALAPNLVGRPAHGHHARLDHVGAIELFDGTFEAQLADRHLEDDLGTLVYPAGGRVAVVEVLAHARLLHPLTGEQKSDRARQRYSHVTSVRPTSRGWRPRSGPSQNPRAGRDRRT